jgi:hypothetical protein
MYRQFGNTHYRTGLAELSQDRPAIAQSGQLDALVALECIGTRLSFSRNDEIYAEGDGSDCWYKVVSGTVRICKLLVDGRPISPSSALVAIALVWTAAANVGTRPRRWMT